MARTYLLNNSAPPKETQNDTGNSSELPGLSPNRALLSLSAPATTSANTTSFLALATQTAQATPLAPSERAALSTNTLSTPLVPLDKTVPPTKTLPPATHHQSATPLAQPLLNNYAAQGSNSLMLMGLDKIDQLKMEPAYQPGQGIAPSEVFSRAPSMALELNQSTPVPHPVERQHFAVLRREVLPPSMAGSMTPTPTHLLAPMNKSQRREMLIDPSPYNQVALRGREMSVDTVMTTQDELTTMSNIFQGQWLLFVNAKETNNYRRMQIALNQAMSTQNTIKNTSPTNGRAAYGEAPTSSDHASRPASVYLPGLYASPRTSGALSTSCATATPAKATAASSPSCRSPSSGQQADGSAPSPRADDTRYWTPARDPPAHSTETVPPPPYPKEESYYAQEHYDPQQRHLHQAYPQWAPYPANGNQASHPYPRNRCQSDPMTRMLQVGNFFMRAERVVNCMQCRRTRGDHDNRMPPLSQLPPGNPQ
ncbi:hypothetical protein PCASD_23022 [Puccinia coronata f. sp. avenae]|uniref:Uncharacterized protein n=1 Tax=Puccinia coronata f. sp. avenae TaxID=200324 RepID=A0A2N5SFQ5_9BASI|nr:hypothetical protein PCASD_23022 [Puccinia coronata f. sp. avenae]